MNDKTERAPYSPRAFRQPGESEEEFEKRARRGKKARYAARHPDHIAGQKLARNIKRHELYAENPQEIQRQLARSRQRRVPKVPSEELERLRLQENIRDSIRKNEMICLRCGARGLGRLSSHLHIHLVNPAQYRAEWGYNRGTPLVCH